MLDSVYSALSTELRRTGSAIFGAPMHWLNHLEPPVGVALFQTRVLTFVYLKLQANLVHHFGPFDTQEVFDSMLFISTLSKMSYR